MKVGDRPLYGVESDGKQAGRQQWNVSFSGTLTSGTVQQGI